MTPREAPKAQAASLPNVSDSVFGSTRRQDIGTLIGEWVACIEPGLLVGIFLVGFDLDLLSDDKVFDYLVTILEAVTFRLLA